MGGKHYPRSMLFIDWGSGLPADPFNGARRPLGHTGTLAAPLRGRPLCGARPHPVRALHPILWPHRWVGWGGGIGGRPPWAHPLVLHASRNPALFLLLFFFFFIHVIGWSGDVLIPDSYQESPCKLSSATHPRGTSPFLIGTQRARLDSDYACKYTCCSSLVPFHHNIYTAFYFQTCRFGKFAIILLLLFTCY